MNPLRPFVLAAAVCGAAGLTAADASAPAKLPSGFSLEHMDLSVDPRVDFAKFAAGTWYKNFQMPADKSRFGAFDTLEQNNWANLKAILEEVSAQTHPAGSIEQKVGDYFATAIDAAGATPIAAELAAVEAIQNMDDLSRFVAMQRLEGSNPLFGAAIFADLKQSDINGLYIFQGGASLPTKEYYFAEQFAKQREEFKGHVAKMFTLLGDSPEAAASAAATVLAVETALAEHFKTPVELRDRLANYHRVSLEVLAAMMPDFPIRQHLRDSGVKAGAVEHVIVMQPKFLAALNKQLASRPLADWKAYLRYRVVAGAAPLLAAPFEEESFQIGRAHV